MERGGLRLGILGCGAASGLHLPAIAGSGRTVVTAAIDVDPSRAEAVATASNAEPLTSLELGLASGLFDALLVLLPHHLHEPATIEALRAGQHVLLEKPMAPTVDAFQVTGETGEITVDLAGTVRLYDETDPNGRVVAVANYLQSFVDQIADFEAAVLDGMQPAASAAYSVGELRAVMAMYRSARSRRWESVW